MTGPALRRRGRPDASWRCLWLSRSESLRKNVTEACVQCYAIEGTYPESISYLEQYYGIRYDGSKYIVSLETGSENQLPDVQITLRR